MSFKIQMPGFLNEPIKGVRGLSVKTDFGAFLEDALVFTAIRAFKGEKLESGKEIPVQVKIPGLPLNADVKSLKATITIQKDASAEKTSLSQMSAVKEGDETRNFSVDIEMPGLPRNISVRLDGGDVFWTYSDAAVQGAHELPDFVEHVNTYLDSLAGEGEEVSLKFLVKSDGPGQVSISIEDVEYSVIKTQSWPNPVDNTTRLDRTFQMDFGSIERLPLERFTGNSAISLSEIRLDVGGEFGPERLLTSVEAHDGKEFATISNDYSMAQGFILRNSLSEAEKPISGIGITGFLSANTEAELYIEIQKDAGGSPSAEPPLASSNLTLAPDEKDWVFAAFESPIELKLDDLYWIVVKGIRGRARVGLQVQSEKYLAEVLVNRGGQLWKSFGNAQAKALLRVVYLPQIDNKSAAIEIGLEGEESSQKPDPRPEAQTITIDVPQGAGDREAVLIVKSRARGTLSIANVIQEYSPVGTKRLFKLRTQDDRRAASK